MGNGSSAADKEQRLRNLLIEEELRREARTTAKAIKLLLLGTGECGKSTILKQMRILHANGFSDEEFELQKAVIRSNLIHSIAAIVEGMSQLVIPYADMEREVDAILVTETVHQARPSDSLSDDVALAVKRLWADGGVQRCYERSSEFQLDDSAKYFLDDVDRIQAPDFRPSVQDILRARARTTGIVEVHFQLKSYKFRVFDVGGQRSERKKWIHCFDSVKAIIFISAMSEYDQVLAEDHQTNRILESMKLFESICNNQYFIETSMILFLNKKDLFEEKIRKTPITSAFPDYTGEQTVEACGRYIAERFKELNYNEKRLVYDHQTCGTDTNQIQHILDSTIDMIIIKNLKDSGLN